MKRSLWLGFVLFLFAICSGCGDVFRPIVIPNPPVFPNPAAAHSVVSINDNGTVVSGSAMSIDVSGDSVMSWPNVGLRPVHAAQQNANTVLVVNQSVPGAGGDSMTRLNFSGTLIASTNTISLPLNSAPNFVAIAPLDTLAYVTLPNYVPPSVGVVDVATNNMVATVAVGNNPYALAVTPDKSKLYVANDSTPCSPPTAGICSISAFNTSAAGEPPTPRGLNGTLSSAPIWLSARSDSQAVYVLETNGTLAEIAITSTAGPDTLTEYPNISVPFAITMTYDSNLNWLYIPGGSALAIVDVSQSAPSPLANLTIAPVAASARVQGDVCSTFSPSAVNAVAAAALPDGSRAYVGSYAAFTVAVNITNAVLDSDNVHTTYTYIPPSSGPDLLPGMAVTISGVTSALTNPSAFNGTFTIASAGDGTFEVTNSPSPKDLYTGGGSGISSNLCPQVTAVWTTSYTVKTVIGIPGFPDATNPNTPYYAAVCANTRFRFMMAAAGDSTRAYMSSCDGGNINFINTSTDTYFQSTPAPSSSRPPIPPSLLPPAQNPVFLIAGP